MGAGARRRDDRGGGLRRRDRPEWSRIEPAPGEYSRPAIEHYCRILGSLAEHGLTAYVTLHHFTLPCWLSERGGWLAPDAVERFERYVERVARDLGDRMPYTCTINEPQIVALFGYLEGMHPPGERNPHTKTSSAPRCGLRAGSRRRPVDADGLGGAPRGALRRDRRGGESYVRPDRDDAYYPRFGRLATVAGIVVGIGTALIASGYSTIMEYIQLLFSFFNAPLFATFIIGMFWKRMTSPAALYGLIAGTLGAAAVYLGDQWEILTFGSALAQTFYGAMVAFVADAVVTVAVTLVTKPKPVAELQGLVYGMANEGEALNAEESTWYRSPKILGATVIGITFFLSLGFL